MKMHDGLDSLQTRDSDDQPSLTDLLQPLWHARKIVAGLTLSVLLVGVIGTLYFAKFRSDGFLQFGGAIPLPLTKPAKDKELAPGIVLADYKRYSAAFSSAARFDSYVQSNNLTATAGVGDMRKVFATGTSVNKYIEPVYPYTKLDAKDLMEQPKDSSNNVIGLRINFDAKTPENAQRMVGLLGKYAIDSIVYLTYSDKLRFKHSELTAKETSLENDIIALKQKIEEYQRKGVALKQIVARYPSSSSQTSRQVISVNEDSARFLSPVTHLMSTEVEASEANEAILKAGREQKQTHLLIEYYDQAKNLIDSSQTGEAILRGLEPIKQRVFSNKDLNDELVKEVYNSISIDNQNAITLYLEKSRFIAGPTIPESRSVRLLTAVMVSLFAGLILSVLVIFGRNWWRRNRVRMGN